jgi:hypothetical protein
MTRTDSLGSSYTPTGFGAYVAVNNNNVAAGNATVSDAPSIVTPPALLTVAITLTSASFSVAYTVSPLGTGARLFSYVSPQRSAGRSFEGDFRLLAVSAAAATSPANLLSAYTAKFGVPVSGNRIFYSGRVYTGGFLSGAFITSQTVS